jgi:GGDEF domain-containing protein
MANQVPEPGHPASLVAQAVERMAAAMLAEGLPPLAILGLYGLVQSVRQGFQPSEYVVFLIGAVTFEVPVDTRREALQVADIAMYAVKHAGKDGIRHAVWDGEPVASAGNSVPS